MLLVEQVTGTNSLCNALGGRRCPVNRITRCTQRRKNSAWIAFQPDAREKRAEPIEPEITRYKNAGARLNRAGGAWGYATSYEIYQRSGNETLDFQRRVLNCAEDDRMFRKRVPAGPQPHARQQGLSRPHSVGGQVCIGI